MPTEHNFWREKRVEADSNRNPSAYQPNALPLGQTGSHFSSPFSLKLTVSVHWGLPRRISSEPSVGVALHACSRIKHAVDVLWFVRIKYVLVLAIAFVDPWHRWAVRGLLRWHRRAWRALRADERRARIGRRDVDVVVHAVGGGVNGVRGVVVFRLTFSFPQLLGTGKWALFPLFLLL